MLACSHVSFSYGNRPLLSDVTIAVQPGEFVCVSGESGSGKSLLVQLLMGLVEPMEGHIEVDGVDLRKLPPAILQLYRSRVGLITQEPSLISRLTVEENIAFPLELRTLPARAMQSSTKQMLALLGLSAVADALPSELSPGQRMMASIGRAFITSPMIVIADEPFHLLDEDQRAVTLKLLKEAHARGASIVVCTQDEALAHKLGARLVRLKDAKGDLPAKAKKEPRHAKAEKIEEEVVEKPAISHPVEEDGVQSVPVRGKHKTSHHQEPPETGGKRKIKITSIAS